MSMLGSPNNDSPANVEAAIMWRDRIGVFEKKVQDKIRESLGLKIPDAKGVESKS
jgi:ubiquitin-conjugating enzyme E2 G2